MTSYDLKRLALVTMIIDHIGAILLPLIPGGLVFYNLFRGVGRIAFPIFAFLIVEGYFHTKDIKKYLLRLGIFAFISEIPFDLALNNKIFYLGSQNIFFTLFLGLLLIYVIDNIKEVFDHGDIKKDLLVLGSVLIFMFLAWLMRVDYQYVGIIIIFLFYEFRGNNKTLAIFLFLATILTMGALASLATLAMIFIWKYNGLKGRGSKMAFYIIYPSHLILLFAIASIIKIIMG